MTPGRQDDPPALLCRLAANAEPCIDLDPEVAVSTQPLDRLGHRGVDLLGRPKGRALPHRRPRCGCRRAGRAGRRHCTHPFSTHRCSRFDVNVTVNSVRLGQLGRWVTCCGQADAAEKGCEAFVLVGMALGSSGKLARRRDTSSDRCRKPPTGAGCQECRLRNRPQRKRQIAALDRAMLKGYMLGSG